jgi:hypothetical protein
MIDGEAVIARHDGTPTAYRFMNVAEVFGSRFATVANLSASGRSGGCPRSSACPRGRSPPPIPSPNLPAAIVRRKLTAGIGADEQVPVGQCSVIVGLGGDLAVERSDQRITMQPSEQRDRAGHLGERN